MTILLSKQRKQLRLDKRAKIISQKQNKAALITLIIMKLGFSLSLGNIDNLYIVGFYIALFVLTKDSMDISHSPIKINNYILQQLFCVCEEIPSV